MQSGMHAAIYIAADEANMRRHWDEDKVADWLKRINCSQYVELFKRKYVMPFSPMHSDRSRQPHQRREPHGDGPDPSQGHGHQESR
jgi:hypothetical protein